MTKYQTVAVLVGILSFFACMTAPQILDKYTTYELNLAKIKAGISVPTCTK